MGILGLCLIRHIEYMLNSTFSVLSASSGLSFDNFLFNLPISWFKLIIHCHRSKPKAIKNYQHIISLVRIH